MDVRCPMPDPLSLWWPGRNMRLPRRRPERGRAGGCRTGSAGGVGADGMDARGVGGVGLDGVDLPRLVAGPVHPHLVLQGVAAGGVVLDLGEQAEVGQPPSGGVDLVGGVDLDAEVVHHRRLVGPALDEHQLERWLGDGEVGVAGSTLGRVDTEQRAVERDRPFEVGHAQGELNARHDHSEACFDDRRDNTLRSDSTSVKVGACRNRTGCRSA
jgi:hypothetical protein